MFFILLKTLSTAVRRLKIASHKMYRAYDFLTAKAIAYKMALLDRDG